MTDSHLLRIQNQRICGFSDSPLQGDGVNHHFGKPQPCHHNGIVRGKNSAATAGDIAGAVIN
jgi:hypothetical protein